MFNNPLLVLALSHSPHTVPTEAAQAGEDQRLSSDGGGIHQEPRTDEAPGGKARGVVLCFTAENMEDKCMSRLSHVFIFLCSKQI